MELILALRNRHAGCGSKKNETAAQRLLHLKLEPHAQSLRSSIPLFMASPLRILPGLANGAGVKIESASGTDYAFPRLDSFEFEQIWSPFAVGSEVKYQPLKFQFTVIF